MRTHIDAYIYRTYIYYIYRYLPVCLSVCVCVRPVLGICQAEQLPLLLGQASKTQFIVARRKPQGEFAHTACPSTSDLLPRSCPAPVLYLSIAFGFAFRLVVVCFWSDFGLCTARPAVCPCALKIENHNRINFGSSKSLSCPPRSRQRNATRLSGIICTGLVCLRSLKQLTESYRQSMAEVDCECVRMYVCAWLTSLCAVSSVFLSQAFHYSAFSNNLSSLSHSLLAIFRSFKLAKLL